MGRLRPIEWLLMAIALVGILCMADQCLGQTAVIEGPKKSAPGDLIVLDASKSQANDFAWRLVNSDKAFLPVEAGRKVVFASGQPGIYSFVLAVALADKVALTQHDVTIGPPNPPPTPIPPSPPNPPGPTPLPPGKYGLATLARDWAPSTAPSLAANARSLASSFHSIASAIAAGTLTLPVDILAETKTSNRTALGADAAIWQTWFANLATKLQSLSTAGTLATPDDYATAWREIAAGLEAVK